MGAGEQSSPAKHPKPTSAQETPPPSYSDWSNSMQAYYGSGAAPPFFASTVASPTPHPYMWGGQHPMMPQYGTPVPYPALYPPAGVYGHPGMPMTPSTVPSTVEMESKAPNGKDRVPNKKSKGTSGNVNAIGVRTGENGKAASSSGNDGATQSAESGNDGSTDASDEDDQHEHSGGKKGSFHQMLADANARNSNSGSNTQTSVPGNPVVSVPTTNLNIGMDLWNPSAGIASMKTQPNHSDVLQTIPPPMVGRESMMADQWVQDERELKRQKRKQSNRESARRSRLRKQAECEELQARVEVLSNENHSLRDELQKLSEECGKLTSENNSIKDELTRLFGPEAVSRLDAQLQSQTDEVKECFDTSLDSWHGKSVKVQASVDGFVIRSGAPLFRIELGSYLTWIGTCTMLKGEGKVKG